MGYVIMLLTKIIMLYVTLWDITFSRNMLGFDVTCLVLMLMIKQNN